MVSEVPSSPHEPGFQATENSFGLSIPFPPIGQSCFWCSHCLVMPLGMGYGIPVYSLSIHSADKPKKKKIYHHHPLLQGFLNHQKVAHKHPFCLLAATL